MIFVCPQLLSAQSDRPAWETYVNMDHFLQPFWKADTIYSEAILPIKNGPKNAEAGLLFKAKKIITVKDTYLQKEYKKGRDWKYKAGKIVLTAKRAIPYFTRNELVFDQKKEGTSLPAKEQGRFVLFSEGIVTIRQLSATYIKEKTSTEGIRPAYAETLAAALNKLNDGGH